MKNKIICGCFNIRLNDMADLIDKGIDNFDDLQVKLSIGSGCPNCYESNKLLFTKLLTQHRITLVEEIFVL